jgi:1-deoxy-D-xylulose-5-phosphate synthase
MDLKNIHDPSLLKDLSVEELEDIAEQLRKVIIERVAINGGHLAPNLGTIELTLALHYCYTTPTDKLIWDVGHQAYAHKILTGRYEEFATIRQQGGLSGFPKLSESPHDHFGVGHASTSIAAAIGYAQARDQREEDHSVVGIIGDGSMTGGLAFEALNNAQTTKGNVTIVLNDNKMSIAPNVGAFSNYLNQLIADPTYNKVRNDLRGMASHLPKRLQELLHSVEDSAKHTFLPGRLFDDLGVRYFGPIDGHDIKGLIQIFNKVKQLDGPCLVHILTEKGRGFKHAEENAYKWHGTVPFDPESGEQFKTPSNPAYTKIFGEAVLELAKEDKRIIGITAAMPSGCGLDIVQKELPEQVVDVGIAEAYAVTYAAGLACGGQRPIVAVYSSFMQRAYDQVIHDVALQKLPVIFAIDRAGLVGADGPTHHGSFDISFMRVVPDLVIMAPSDENELRNMLYTAMQYDKGPVAIRYPRGNVSSPSVKPFSEQKIGKMKEVQKGSGILLLGVGHSFHEMERVHTRLQAEGIQATLVDVRYIKPLDIEALRKYCANHQLIVSLEDNALPGGFGSAVGEFLNRENLSQKVRLLSVGLPDAFVEHGEVSTLHEQLGMDAASITKQILEIQAEA